MKTLLTILIVAAIVSATAPARQDPDGPDKPTEAVPREGCVTAQCHPDIKSASFLHGPLQANACDGCHTLTDARQHTYVMTRESDKLCQFCHELDLSMLDVVHEPLVEGECLPCHDPHGGAGPSLLRGRDYPDLCGNCHEDVLARTGSVHGPAASGACGACHAPHGSTYPKLLNVQGTEQCLPCHLTIEDLMTHSSYFHDPASVDCLLCHNPHATDHVSLLNEEPLALCGGCHEGILNTVDTAVVEHAAVTTERECLNCHTPHASEIPRMLRKNVKNLCFECHDKEIELDGGRTLKNMKALIESGTSLHGPVAQSNCTVCHDIHGGGHARLLRYEFPSEYYYPFKTEAYSLCFSCHDRQLVLELNTTSLTDFRNGETNLHFVHVNQRKGRSCLICHDTHASDRDQHIHQSIPYGPGGWMLPINFESLEHGGRCAAGCHRGYEYNRDEPVTYPTVTEDGTWKGSNLPPPGEKADKIKPPHDRDQDQSPRPERSDVRLEGDIS